METRAAKNNGAQTVPPNGQATESLVKPAAYGDSPASTFQSDTLGFTRYVQAVRDFLLHPKTDTPLCMSVEGEWGSGKSSFLRQLRDALSRGGAKTVMFNAWRHSSDESMWASFALECIRQLRGGRGLRVRLRSSLGLARDRIDWEVAGPSILAFAWRALLLLLFTGVVLWLLAFGGSGTVAATLKTAHVKVGDFPTELLLSAGAGVSYVVAALLAFKKLRDVVGDPFEIDLLKYTEDPGYRAKVAFAEKFNDDLSKIIKNLAENEHKNGSNTFVFIDDLDRCDVASTAELMRAVNMITSTDARGLVFVIAMDREVVAAALAARYEKLIPYLTFSDAIAENNVLVRRGLDYGSAFMEKFVQLPFRVPKATTDALWSLLKSNVGTVAALDPPAFANVTEDSERIRTLVESVAFVFNHNPRRIKQFINLLRLNVHIGVATGMLDAQADYDGGQMPDLSALTVEKLGKFLALILRWPRFVEYLSADRFLLAGLQRHALNSAYVVNNDPHKWSDDPTLMRLLATMDTSWFPDTKLSKDERACIFSLEALDADILLQVAPTAGSIKMDEKPVQPHCESVLNPDTFEPTGCPSLVHSTHGVKRANLELVIPCVTGGLAHFVYDRDAVKNRWLAHRLLSASESFEAASLIESTFDDGNLELAARTTRENRLALYWRFAPSSAEWKGPYKLHFTTPGKPVLFQGTRTSAPRNPACKADFQLVVAKPRAGLALYYRDNTDVHRGWHGPSGIISPSATADPLAIFELATQNRSDLRVMFLDRDALQMVDYVDGRASPPTTIRNGLTVAPAMVSGRNDGDELQVVLLADKRLVHLAYDVVKNTWRDIAVIEESAGDVEAICAARGGEHRIDVVVRAKTSLLHFVLPEAGLPWRPAANIVERIRFARTAAAASPSAVS